MGGGRRNGGKRGGENGSEIEGGDKFWNHWIFKVISVGGIGAVLITVLGYVASTALTKLETVADQTSKLNGKLEAWGDVAEKISQVRENMPNKADFISKTDFEATTEKIVKISEALTLLSNKLIVLEKKQAESEMRITSSIPNIDSLVTKVDFEKFRDSITELVEGLNPPPVANSKPKSWNLNLSVPKGDENFHYSPATNTIALRWVGVVDLLGKPSVVTTSTIAAESVRFSGIPKEGTAETDSVSEVTIEGRDVVLTIRYLDPKGASEASKLLRSKGVTAELVLRGRE